jgi:hypothetical protein
MLRLSPAPAYLYAEVSSNYRSLEIEPSSENGGEDCEPSDILRYINRAALVIIATITAIFVPCFGAVSLKLLFL